MIAFVLGFVFAGISSAQTCVSPATCEAPNSAFSHVASVPSRSQWVSSGGYCGSLSISSILLNFGAYVSQDVVRRAAGAGEHGVEVGTVEIGGALEAMKFEYESWDHENMPKPQGPAYLRWLKSHLVAGHPVVWFILCKGDPHDAEGQTWDHIEPVWGIFSNHSLLDTVVYDDDVVVHGSDYGATSFQEGPRLYRPFGSLLDTVDMNGNCLDAQPGWMKNEFYPCVAFETSFGTAITGPVGAGLHVSVSVDRFVEPNFVWDEEAPVNMSAVVTVHRVIVGERHAIYRYDDYAKVPTDGIYEGSDAEQVYHFTPQESEHSMIDPVPVLSSGMAFYRAALAPLTSVV